MERLKSCCEEKRVISFPTMVLSASKRLQNAHSYFGSWLERGNAVFVHKARDTGNKRWLPRIRSSRPFGFLLVAFPMHHCCSIWARHTYSFYVYFLAIELNSAIPMSSECDDNVCKHTFVPKDMIECLIGGMWDESWIKTWIGVEMYI